MSEKISTIIIKVDLQCNQCYRKIRKTLCKLQDRGKITSIVYDEKNDTVIVKGPSDPKKLIKQICCDACKVIKDIQILEDKPKPPPEKPKPDPPPPAPEPAPEPAPPAPEPQPPAPPPPPPPAPEPAPAPAPAPPPAPAPEPEPEPPKKVEPDPPKPEPEVQKPDPVYPYPFWTPGSVPPPGPVCCCRPWFEAYYGGCKCCSCGCIYGSTCHGPSPPQPPPPPQVIYVNPPPCYDGPKTCQFICEDDPSCRIM
ncbi:putative protein TsetseEP isoform X1 [Iris pallida]|uniref:Uncharacterized protein n=1 Tax=Iris pallida TaxID=29817 RepID=A0AAX6IE14_IRIPA|nr:putative protein TsetseEP isoform X1 [Iris pallida]